MITITITITMRPRAVSTIRQEHFIRVFQAQLLLVRSPILLLCSVESLRRPWTVGGASLDGCRKAPRQTRRLMGLDADLLLGVYFYKRPFVLVRSVRRQI